MEPIPEPTKRKCSRCKCWRVDFTRNKRRCDVCTDPVGRHKRWLELKANSKKYKAFLASKRVARAAQKAKRLSGYRPVELPTDAAEDPDIDHVRVAAAAYTEARRQSAEKARELRVAPLVAQYEGGASTTEISVRTGLSPGYVYKLLKDAGVQFRNRASATSVGMSRWHSNRPTRHNDT